MSTQSAAPPRVLVVAGHDPTGGAGVAIDRLTLERFGARATCVVSAWTEQDGRRVRRIRPRPPEVWLEEALAALAEGPRGLKTGLLSTPADVAALGRLLDALRERVSAAVFVLDPVLAATGGERFLSVEARRALLEELAPRGGVWTPNLAEAAELTGVDAAELERTPARREEVARTLLALGLDAVVLKGGHGREDPVRDLVLARGGEAAWLAHPRVVGAGIHGSGCRFASAVAGQLVCGVPLVKAAERAGVWLAACIAQGTPDA